VPANRNRGSFGWQEPYEFHRVLGTDGKFFTSSGGRQGGRTEAIREAALRGVMSGDPAFMNAAQAGLFDHLWADVGDANGPPPVPLRKWPNAVHEDDPIDMIEINGVWMCEADTRFARGIDCGAQPGYAV
jgi:hypothetical protein